MTCVLCTNMGEHGMFVLLY